MRESTQLTVRYPVFVPRGEDGHSWPFAALAGIRPGIYDGFTGGRDPSLVDFVPDVRPVYGSPSSSFLGRNPVNGVDITDSAKQKRRHVFQRIIHPTAIVLLLVLTTSTQAATARLDLYPPDIQLRGGAARQRIVVVAKRSDGVTEDVTAKAAISLADGRVARVDNGTVRPLANGQTKLEARYDGQSAATSLAVQDVAVAPMVSFRHDVMPVFMRAGCNTGGCHGSARGKDGFRLSLFGFDPEGDYFRITRELGYRRVNLAVPEDSLLLQKALGAVPHTGGKRFEPSSEYAQTMLAWLQGGAPGDPANLPTVESIEILPREMLLEGAGAKQQMIVRARYSDGSQRDVTSLALFYSNNDNSAPVTPGGLVTAANRGEAFVLARFDTKTVGSQAIVIPAGLSYTPPSVPPANYIDDLVNAKLQKLRILPSELCSDPTFLRRATIDITGALPTEDECKAFVEDKSPDKRAKLVDRLLARKAFAEIWAMKWAELLMVRSGGQANISYKSIFLYSNWLTEQIAGNVPLDKIVRKLLASRGGTFSAPETNFYQVERETLKTAENVAQVFMGVRVQCAQCHNHPFDRWTMDDYYSFAAFFSQIGRKEGEDYRETIIFNSGGGEVNHPLGGRVMPPKFLGGPKPDCSGKDRRQVLADWLTAPDNPYFAPSVGNRIWAHFFGLGIVEPVDDVRVSNPPSNPELFQALGRKLVEYKYDFKRLVRDICLSQAYQRATRTNAGNEGDQRNFAHARVRRIQSEMLRDCITQVTETKDKFRGLPMGSRAVQIADGATSDYFLRTFGRSPRETVCSCDIRSDPTLSQALTLLNGEVVQGKIRAGRVIPRLLEAKKRPEEIIKVLFARCLGRDPAADELEKLKTLIDKDTKRAEALEDIFWSLLNSREFCFNH
jgi:hypothetical protein